MTVQTYAPQYQQFAPQQQQKQSDPFWYRQNSGYLFGVTNAPSNMQLGIENISLKPASANQTPHGILFNGLLRSVIGSISFQVRVSPRTGAPFVQTISTESGVDQQGQKTYWEHINLNPPIKAQILRHAEALMTGQVPMQQPMQQQMYQQQPMGGMPMQQPMGYGQQQPMYGQMQQQMPMQQMGMQQQFPNYGQQAPAYTPPAPQDLGQQAPADKPVDQPADKVDPPLVEDDLPI
jgi:hypothetical protein